jgi:hypothetical protein
MQHAVPRPLRGTCSALTIPPFPTLHRVAELKTPLRTSNRMRAGRVTFLCSKSEEKTDKGHPERKSETITKALYLHGLLVPLA